MVKNTLTRRAAEAAGAEALLALLEGPSAIAFIESDGDTVAVAKALADSARDTKVLAIRGGVMQGREISAADVEELAKLPPLDVLRGQVLGAIIAPLTQIARAGQRAAAEPVGLIDARIEQLGRRRRDTSGGCCRARAPRQHRPKPKPSRRGGGRGSRAAEPRSGRRAKRPHRRAGRGSRSRPKTNPNQLKPRRHRRWLQLTPSSSSSAR